MGKALFFDIDGTVLSEITKEVPESAVRALHLAREKGHLLFINTGRTRCSVPRDIRRLPFDGLLCGCGICLEYREEIFFEYHLTDVRRREIVRQADKCLVDVIYEGMEDVFFSARVSRFDGLENTRRYMAGRGLGLERYIEQGDCAFDKMFVYTDAHSRREDYLSSLKADMEIIDRGGGTYECAPKGFSKATAIAMMLDRLGMEKDQAFVFGDSSNDLAMFQYADHAVAMGKHDAVLEPFTEYVTDTVEEDGLWTALEHYGLI